MSEIIISEQYKAAIELNQKIIITAQAAQQNLYDMCVMLKQMRDDKLYKELGYANFEDYCENKVGMNRRNAYRYIAVIENVKNVTSMSQIGMTKLSLLASLSESQQEEIQQTVNLEETSVRELKAEITKLKAANKKAETNLKSLQTELDNEKKSNEELMSLKLDKERAEMQLNRVQEELESANERITDLENRPVEVAVQEDETSKAIIRDLNRKLSEADQDHINALEEQRIKYQKQINQLEDQLEQAKNQPAETVTVKNDEEIFKAYYSIAVKSFESLLKFIAGCSEQGFFVGATNNLLGICKEKLGEIRNV